MVTIAIQTEQEDPNVREMGSQRYMRPVYVPCLPLHLHLQHSSRTLSDKRALKYLLGKHTQLHGHQRIIVMFDDIVLFNAACKIAEIHFRIICTKLLAFFAFLIIPPRREKNGLLLGLCEELAESWHTCRLSGIYRAFGIFRCTMDHDLKNCPPGSMPKCVDCNGGHRTGSNECRSASNTTNNL
jgi:hypothetical protein